MKAVYFISIIIIAVALCLSVIIKGMVEKTMQLFEWISDLLCAALDVIMEKLFLLK